MPGSSLSGFSPTRQIRDKKEKEKKEDHNRFNSRQAVRSNPFMGKKPQVEVTQGSRLWLTSTLKPLDLPRVTNTLVIRIDFTTQQLIGVECDYHHRKQNSCNL